jgi:hypothetical protein
MVKKPFGCLTIPGLVTAFLTALVVVSVGLVRGGILFNPGQLNAQAGNVLGGVTSHAALSGTCSACHAYFWQNASMAARCVSCHTDIAAELQDPSTLHGDEVKRNPRMTCRVCHPDHRGANASLLDLSKVDISHNTFGYALTAHQRQSDGSPFECNTCHLNDYSIFDQAVCSSCHQQINAEFMSAHLQAYGVDCLGCHDGIDSYGQHFDHNIVAFQLTGKHDQLDCGACHTAARSIADLKATPQECFSCHARDDAHQGQFGTGCASCHTTEGWLPATFDHSKTQFPLTGAHISLACTQCHTAPGFSALSTDCFSCHAKDDAHQGEFGTGCDSCHTTDAWLPATFDHSKTKFPLNGAHIGLTCSQCHANQVFTGLDAACASCHLDPSFHVGLFAGIACDQCHNTSAWSPAAFNLAHPNSCGEVTCIDHERATCRDCHPSELASATCLKCHDSNNPGDGEGGGGDD